MSDASPPPLRIGHVLASPFPALRGTQGYLFELLRAQLEAGHEVHLFCYAGALGGEVPTGLHLHRAPRLPGVPSSLRSRPGPARPLNDLALLLRLLGGRATRRMEVLHGHNHEGGLAALLAGRALGVPVVHQVHGNLQAELRAWARSGTARGLGRVAPLAGLLFDGWLPGAADACLRLRPPLTPGAGEVLPVGVSPLEDQTRAPHFDRRLIERALGEGEWVAYAGNLDPYQDLPRLFETMQALRRERESARLVLISHDPPAARERVVREGGLPAGALRVVEAEDAAAAAHWIAGAGLLLVPRTEAGGLPLKILNAIGLGVPVVTTRAAAAGLRETEGVVVAEESAESLAAAVAALLDEPARRKSLERRAARFARAHPWSRVAAACEQVYRRLVPELESEAASGSSNRRVAVSR